MKLGVLFGGSSNEHDVSIVSASSIIKALNKEKYEIVPIYMDKYNNFYKWDRDIKDIKTLEIGDTPKDITYISDPFIFLKDLDCIFIMVHGKNGEDGVLSAIFDFLNIKYVGNKTISSVITMDKVLTKNELEINGIKTSKYKSFYYYNGEYIMDAKTYDLEGLLKDIESILKYPMFVKPANSGSSIGITKVNDKNGLKSAIDYALKSDNHILIEEEVRGRELECGILEKNGKILASCIGEVKINDEFYSFDAKYKNNESKTIIPANISLEIEEKIKEKAIIIFKMLNLHLYSRIDFFLTQDNEIILNEINTIPGFTSISMYPKLFCKSGISFEELLDTLIHEALK